jgi:hypothetical protein
VAQIATLQAKVDTLQGQVSKLEGNITARDLVGTYTIAGIQTRLQGGGAANAFVGSAALFGSMTLNADGTGSMTMSGDGSVLSVLGWTLTPSTLGNGNPGGSQNFAWTYADGVLGMAGQVGGFNVGLAGRLIVVPFPEFHAAEGHADVSLLIFYRLQ